MEHDDRKELNRRAFIGVAAAMLPLPAWAERAEIPIIDTHIHLFDTNRPQGVPWPAREDKVLYKAALPARYERIARPLNVVGAIEIEASPLLEDNQWVLDVAAKSPIVVGMIGDLEPGTAEFRKQFDRFKKNQLFRGIRYGNLWGRDLGARLKEPLFIEDMKLLAQAGLAMDTANPDAELIQSVVRLSDKVPDLKVIIDHLPHLPYPLQAAARNNVEESLRELGRRPRIYVKLSEVIAGDKPGTQVDAARYRPTLDHLFGIFGEDRVLYGSDWPNSDLWGSYEEELRAVQQYFATKSRLAQEKYFWRNSVEAYHWMKRDEKQPAAKASE
jgi:predicted TIM-barrel fold metal-dependent hydrolase